MQEEFGGSNVSFHCRGLTPVKDDLGFHGPKASSIGTIGNDDLSWVCRHPSWRRLNPQALILQARSSDRQD